MNSADDVFRMLTKGTSLSGTTSHKPTRKRPLPPSQTPATGDEDEEADASDSSSASSSATASSSASSSAGASSSASSSASASSSSSSSSANDVQVLRGSHSSGSSAGTSTSANTDAKQSPAKRRKLDATATASTTDAAVALRAEHHIKVSGGENVPAPVASFAELRSQGVPKWLLNVWLHRQWQLAPFYRPAAAAHVHLQSLRRAGFESPTPIQMQAMPILLQRHDLLAYSETGSGKTLAFLVPLLALLRAPRHAGARLLIVSPTRELAKQIFHVLLQLTDTDGGGGGGGGNNNWQTLWLTKENCTKNTLKLAAKFDVVVGTPWRLVRAVDMGLSFAGVEYVVFDEADRLFDGVVGTFVKQVDRIVAACTHAKRRMALFSATRAPAAEALAATAMHAPVRIMIGMQNRALASVTQRLVYCGNEAGKLLGLQQILRGGVRPPVLVFVQSTKRAAELSRELRMSGVRAAALHGDLPQAERDATVERFRMGDIFVLVATDVLARGIDYKAITCVINYDVPQSVNDYVHRVGRTGRGGRQGEAITLYSTPDRQLVRAFADVIRDAGGQVPDWIFTMRKAKYALVAPPKLTHDDSRKKRKQLRQRPMSRDTISSASGRLPADNDDDDDDDNSSNK